MYHLSGTWLKQLWCEYTHKSLCQLSLTLLEDMWCCPLLQPPQPWKSICACILFFFSLSVNAQPHSVRSAMANTHRSAAIPLLLMPRFASPVPPGCSSGSEATMCRTVCLSAEGMSHIFIQRWEDLKLTHSFRSMSEEVKILVLLQFSSFQKVFK